MGFSCVYLAVDGEGRRVVLKELLFALVPGAAAPDVRLGRLRLWRVWRQA